MLEILRSNLDGTAFRPARRKDARLDAMRVNELCRVETAVGLVAAPPGHYVVRDEYGMLLLLSPKEFAAEFAFVNPEMCRGRFHLPADWVMSNDIHVGAVGANIRILSAEHRVGGDMLEYTGVSPLFDVLAPGEPIPLYELEVLSATELKVRRIE